MLELTANQRFLASKLFEMGAVKFGDFMLKSGQRTPIYIDLRLMVSKPSLMCIAAQELWRLANSFEDYRAELICGVPYTALPLATCVAIESDLPLVICRKEVKDYGLRRMVEGTWSPNQVCLLVEDVITAGASVAETARLLRKEGIVVKQAVVFVDRCQGGSTNLSKLFGIEIKSLFKLTDLMDLIYNEKLITYEHLLIVSNFLKHGSCDLTTTSNCAEDSPISFTPGLNTRMQQLIKSKKSHLCVSLDRITSPTELLRMADLLGPKVIGIKLHLDTLPFSPQLLSLPHQLRQLADRHGFLIIEDRKLADIGQICLDQLIRGFWRLSEWCDLVTVHCLPGSGPLEAVRKAAEWSLTGSGDSEVAGGLSSHPRGALVEANNGKPKPLKHHLACLVVAEMSSKGSLIDSAYKSKCLEFAKQYPNVVSGFVCQSPFTNLSDAYAPSYWVPGVNLKQTSDSLDQTYSSPIDVFLRFPSERISSTRTICIVGRGITESQDPLAAAEEYRKCIEETNENQ